MGFPWVFQKEMRIEKMTDQEFQLWVSRSKENDAKDKMRANNLTEPEATEIAEKDFLRLLPDGLNSKDNFLFTLKHGDDSSLGYLWFGVSGAGSVLIFV
jgi:hypothetical protein